MVPRSCGPCCSLHISVISLPDFTYKSGGPSIRAFNSALEDRWEKSLNKHFDKKRMFDAKKLAEHWMNFPVQWLSLNAFLMKIKHDTFAVRSSIVAFCALHLLWIYVFGKLASIFCAVSVVASRSVKCKMPSFKERHQQKNRSWRENYNVKEFSEALILIFLSLLVRRRTLGP